MCSIGICTESSMEFGFLDLLVFFVYPEEWFEQSAISYLSESLLQD